MRTREERLERAKAMGLTLREYADYLDALRADYRAVAFSTSRLLSRLVMAGGWPF